MSEEWFEKAADKGSAAAMVGLGKMYFRGYDGIEKDYGKARELFKKAAAEWRTTGQENQWKVFYAFYYLGRIYTEGLGMDKDLMLGQRCFIFGAGNGNVPCTRAIAMGYEKGTRGFAKSENRAKFWYAKCARILNDKQFSFADDMAMHSFGLLHQQGSGGLDKDLEKSREWFAKSAALGNIQCLANLARAYRDGKGVPKDLRKSIELYEAAAVRGDASAQNGLSWTYYKGEGIERDLAKALMWGMKAAENGSGGAMETLYRMYRDGDGVEKDEAKALEWLKKASEKDISVAMAALGDCYEHGLLGVEIDLDKAVALYKKAAEADDTMGMFCLGLCYKEGKGVPQSDKEALFWLTKAAEEEDDDLHYDEQAIAVLADWYYEGNFKSRVERFERLDAESNKKAVWNLYRGYRKGKGLAKDPKRKMECLKTAAELGNKKAQNNLGWAYYKGIDLPRNLKRAFEWTKKAVDNGIPHGMETLFRMYRDGDGVRRNEAEALRWLEISARNPEEQGLAISELGECHEHGLLGLKKDVSKAFKLYYQASQRSKCPGKFNRGRCHLYGIGTPVDVPRAIEWLTKAADKEDGDDYKYDLLAMALLVKLYSEGKLVEKNETKAAEWQGKLDELKAKRLKEIPGYVSPV